MKRIAALALAALTVLLLGACATPPVDEGNAQLDDIMRIPLASAPVADSAVSASSGMALSSSSSDRDRMRREEAMRHELGVDHAPDGSWDGCFMRGWGEGC